MQGDQLPVAADGEGDRRAGRDGADRVAKLVEGAHRMTVEGGHRVARPQPGQLGRRGRRIRAAGAVVVGGETGRHAGADLAQLGDVVVGDADPERQPEDQQ